MEAISVIAIFDIGKTNKKLLLFDEHYKLVWEISNKFGELVDEDGFPCEDVEALTFWIHDSIQSLLKDDRFLIKAINFSSFDSSESRPLICTDTGITFSRRSPSSFMWHHTTAGRSCVASCAASSQRSSSVRRRSSRSSCRPNAG